MESARFTLGLRMINGKMFDFENPHLAEYAIEDVAKVLGKKCRFSDHIEQHYSVAEHCCHAHDLYPRNRRGALMHDAPEFVVDDVITPVKRRIQGFDKIEASVASDMARRFNYEEPDALTFKLVDTLLFHVEEYVLYPNIDKIYDIEIPIKCWSPQEAADQFLARFYFNVPGK